MATKTFDFCTLGSKIIVNTIFKRMLWEYLMKVLGQSAKLNIRRSVFVAKSLHLMSVECTTPMVLVA